MAWRSLALLLFACCSEAARPRTGRDWARMQEADWERIDQEWETEEERQEYMWKPPPDPTQEKMEEMIELTKTDPMAVKKMWEEERASEGMTAMNATLDYPGCCTKEKTKEIAVAWGAMMLATGSDVETFIIEDDQVIFSTKFGRHAHQIRDFVLAQPECVKLDWDLDHFEGPALTPEWKVKNEAKLAKLAEEQAAKEAQELKVKKAEEKLRKRRKAERKARKKKEAKTEL